MTLTIYEGFRVAAVRLGDECRSSRGGHLGEGRISCSWFARPPEATQGNGPFRLLRPALIYICQSTSPSPFTPASPALHQDSQSHLVYWSSTHFRHTYRHAQMPPGPSLQFQLEAIVPRGVTLQAYHLSANPSPASALFAALPGRDNEDTICEPHFLAISSPAQGDRKEVLVYAIEVLIYTTRTLTTVFVSKADSSGFSSRLGAPKGSPSIIAAVTSAFVTFLLETRLATSRVVLSLFARSQHQYLFPGSIENSGKHVLDDRQLIKWWARVLDRVLRLHGGPDTPSCPYKATAHLVVPGCDKGETKAFFPPSSRHDPPSEPKWINSYPVDLLVVDTSVAPRHLIPRLPDDPKSRFLEDLDGDFTDGLGNWRSVKNLDQFWEMMSYRQECSAGRLVGFLWVVFPQGLNTHAASNGLELDGQTDTSGEHVASSSLLTPGNSQLRENGITETESQPMIEMGMVGEPKSPPPSSPPEPLQERTSTAVLSHDLVESGRNVAVVASVNPENTSKGIKKVQEAQGEITMDAGDYQSLMDFLLQTDFAGEDLAAENTRAWVEKALELSGAATFGQPIHGRHVLAQSTGPKDMSSSHVNLLTGVRKKRKADNTGESASTSETAAISPVPTTNTLSAGLVRKKPKY